MTVESIQKDGYVLSPKANRSFNYLNPDVFLPDEQNPHIFRMWKLTTREQLKSFHASRMMPYDGNPIWIDVLEGRITEGSEVQGDLKITLQRTPLEIALTNREAFDWEATIATVSGGLVLTDDEFGYVAPADGYAGQLHIAMPKGTNNWTPRKQLSFFLKAREGRVYGRISVEFRADYSGPKTGFTIDASLNPTGSRNLQP